MLPNSMQRFRKPALGIAVVAVAILTISLSVWGVCQWRTSRAITRAEAVLEKGYGALAADIIDCHRHAVISTEHGCSVMVASYYSARRVDRLEWAAQACLEKGHDGVDLYLALAAVREFTGRDNEALGMLSQLTAKFDKLPDVYYRLGLILKRNKNDDAAAAYFVKAVERAPGNNQLAMDTLEYLTATQKWADARKLAEKLQTVATQDPQVKLIIARAFKMSGDAASAHVIAEQAKALLATTQPDVRGRLEKTYADVLGGASVPVTPKKDK